jgi:signal transduction histidine kinase
MPALTADGAELLVEASGRAVTFDGRPARVVAVRDITERERVRQTLEEQNQRLRELDALKSEFVALVSHELRTPLTSIIAHLDVLDAGEAGSLNERQRRYVEVASRNARRLGRLVDDLLLAARADAGQFAIERAPVELAPLAEEVVEELRPTAAAAGVELEAVVAATPIVAGDRERILQLLGNLVGNALDATPAGGAVDVHVDLSGSEAILAVSDTGIGIAAADHPHLFDRFYRTREAASRAAAGAGLGLAVVKEIVDAHHGTITVESEPRRGSRFTVRLPLVG